MSGILLNLKTAHLKTAQLLGLSSIAFLPLLLVSTIAPAQAALTQTCSIVPTAAKPSPLAMRASLTFEEQDDRSVTVKYSPAPSPFNQEQPPVLFNSIQILTFYQTNVAAVRDRMLKDPQYFKTLTQFPEDVSFKTFNEALVCKSVAPTESAIDTLPDGSYRFWSGPTSSTVTDKDILAGGEGVGTFLLNKTGKKIVGYFARPNDFAMCMTGTIANGKVVGDVMPIENAYKPGGNNTNYDPNGYLKFGTWKNTGNRGYYANSTIDLTRFNRINLGPRKAPTLCR